VRRGGILDEMLFKKFDVRSTPFILFLNADGSELDWIAGYMPPPEKWHRWILAVLSGADTVQSLSRRRIEEPKNPEILIKLGLKYQARQQREKALTLFKEAASLDPSGKIMLRQDNGEEVSCREMADFQYARTYLVTFGAIEQNHLEKFIRDYPASRLARNALLDLTRGTQLDDEEGAATFIDLMAKFPHDPEVLERYVSQILRYQDRKEAKETLDRGLELAERTVDVLNENDLSRAASSLAQLHLLKEDAAKAEQAFGREFMASQIKSWADALMSYAEFWEIKNRNLEDAEAAVRLALSLRPEDAQIRRAAARIYFYAPAKPEKALEIYGPEFAKSLESNPAGLYEYFNFWLSRKMNEESAMNALETLLRLRPESVHFRSSAATALLKAGYRDRALAVFGPEFIARHPNDHSVLYDYGFFWIGRNENLESAVPALEKAAIESPRKWTDQQRVATALDKLNKPESVLFVFGPAYLPYIKDEAFALSLYAQFWWLKKTNLNNALEALDMASRLPSLIPLDRLSIASGYLRAGRQDRADEVFGPAYVKTIAGNAAALRTYALFWKDTSKNRLSALEAVRSACELEKNDSRNWTTLAELLLVHGKPAEAMAAIDKAASLTKSRDLLERCERIKKQIKDALDKK